jgi:hypothetical protein
MRRILTILAAGTLALSACSDDTVGPPANYVFVVIPNQADLALTQDDSVDVSAVVKDTVSGGQMYHPSLDWSSDDPDVAVVEENGDGWQVRATGPGATTIHAVFNAYHGPVEGAIAVSVTGVAATAFTVADNDVSLFPGDADTIRVMVKDADGNELSPHRISWESSADSIATVEPLTRVWTDTITVGEEDSVVVDSVTYYAVVTASEVGEAEITGSVEGLTDQTITVTIADRPVESVSMNPDAAALHVGDKLTITATPKAENGESLDRDITWLSSNPLVATVDTLGVVTAVAPGNASITAMSGGKVGITSLLVVANDD